MASPGRRDARAHGSKAVQETPLSPWDAWTHGLGLNPKLKFIEPKPPNAEAKTSGWYKVSDEMFDVVQEALGPALCKQGVEGIHIKGTVVGTKSTLNGEGKKAVYQFKEMTERLEEEKPDLFALLKEQLPFLGNEKDQDWYARTWGLFRQVLWQHRQNYNYASKKQGRTPGTRTADRRRWSGAAAGPSHADLDDEGGFKGHDLGGPAGLFQEEELGEEGPTEPHLKKRRVDGFDREHEDGGMVAMDGKIAPTGQEQATDASEEDGREMPAREKELPASETEGAAEQGLRPRGPMVLATHPKAMTEATKFFEDVGQEVLHLPDDEVNRILLGKLLTCFNGMGLGDPSWDGMVQTMAGKVEVLQREGWTGNQAVGAARHHLLQGVRQAAGSEDSAVRPQTRLNIITMALRLQE